MLHHEYPCHAGVIIYDGEEISYPSYAGYTYYVSFIDAFSRYTWIFPIKSKAETIVVFKNFKSMVELQLNTKIKSIQLDWGGEYKPFSNLLASFAISYRLICPHTHGIEFLCCDWAFRLTFSGIHYLS